VHELREPTFTFDEEGKDEPYYFNGPFAAENELDAYCLVYPTAFLLKICTTSINSVFKYLEENELAPALPFGPNYFWLRELQDG
jgi:hypothetical protein